MRRPQRPLHAQCPRRHLQAHAPVAEPRAERRHVLHVVEAPEEAPALEREPVGRLRQRSRAAFEQLDQVTDVVEAVEEDEVEGMAGAEDALGEESREVGGVDAVAPALVEVEALGAEEAYRLRRAGVGVGVEVGEVELPGHSVGGNKAGAIEEGDPQLDDLSPLDVALHVPVAVRLWRVARGGEEEPWELDVDGDHGVAVSEAREKVDLLPEIAAPYLSDLHGVEGWKSWTPMAVRRYQEVKWSLGLKDGNGTLKYLLL